MVQRYKCFQPWENMEPSDDGDYYHKDDYSALTQRLARMVAWLEENQPDVFRRGLWDAIEQEEK
jgi:hypothetical protein